MQNQNTAPQNTSGSKEKSSNENRDVVEKVAERVYQLLVEEARKERERRGG